MIHRRSALFCLLLLAAGCAPMARLGPAGAHPALVTSGVSYPNSILPDDVANIPYQSDAIEILHWVEKGRGSANLTGRVPGVPTTSLVGARRSDYQATYQQLLQENELDGLLNLTLDTKRWDLNLYFIRFTYHRTVLGGIGFRFLSREHGDTGG